MLVLFSIITVLVCILYFRLHAFLTLLLAGLLVALFSSGPVLDRYVEFELNRPESRRTMTEERAAKLTSMSSTARLAEAFGQMAGKVGILIALASVIGQCLLESKAATVIVDRMLAVTGLRRAPEALALSSFVLGIPVFFDTVFYLMIPLARSLREKVGSDYVLFILSILAGGSLAHSLIPPTPGPLLIAGILGIDIGTMMITGLMVSACGSIVSLAVARLINHYVQVPLRPVADAGTTASASDSPSAEDSADSPTEGNSAGNNLLDHERESMEENRPSLVAALLPIVLPVILIAVGSFVSYSLKAGNIQASQWTSVLKMLGDKNVALAIGLLAATRLVAFVPANQRASLVNRSLASAGNIILITAAGGAFGMMLRQAGIEQTIAGLAGDAKGLWILPIAFLVTAAIRTLQGSATVAMITAAGVLQGFASTEALGFHPVYLAMAIGAGSKPVSWMTDSAFWVITRMTGMTEAEGLRTVTPMSVAMGVSALGFTMMFAWLLPGVSG